MDEIIYLYTGPQSMFGMKTEITFAEKGLPFERVELSYDNADRYRPHHPQVTRVNPKGQVPLQNMEDLLHERSIDLCHDTTVMGATLPPTLVYASIGGERIQPSIVESGQRYLKVGTVARAIDPLDIS